MSCVADATIQFQPFSVPKQLSGTPVAVLLVDDVPRLVVGLRLDRWTPHPRRRFVAMLSDPTSIEERNMDEVNHRDPADPLGLEAGRLDVLKEILATAEGLDAEASDDDLDAWWGTVEIDRLASGLTLAAIGKLSEPGHRDDSSGPWIQKSDPNGDEPTQLTPDGRAAVRRVLAV